MDELAVVVVAPTAPPPTELTAQWARVLHERLGTSSLLLEGPEAVRARLISTCAAAPGRALAFFGHGTETTLLGHKEEAGARSILVDTLESELRFSWVYALACLSACELGVALGGPRCQVFVGFDRTLFFPHEDRHALIALAEVAITIPLALHAGHRDEHVLREKIRDMAAQAQDARGGMDQLSFMAIIFLGQLQEFVMLP